MYVEVALPINNRNTFTYKVDETLNPKIGQRVLIDFNYKLQTGITIGFPKDINFVPEKVKKIIEIIDDVPVINEELYKLAKWITNYYYCPIGLVFKAMLPAGCNVNTIQKLTLKNKNYTNKKYEKIISALTKNSPAVDINILKKQQIPSLFKKILEMEEQNIIEIERNVTNKLKKKTSNFIELINNEKNKSLTTRQAALLEYIKKKKEIFPVAEIKNHFSYYTIKKLKDKGYIKIIKREIYPDIFKNIKKTKPENFNLSLEQNKAIEQISQSISKGDFKTFLLHGITASGKTEVYIRIMKKVIKKNKTAIILIPEISLTPQTVERFYAHFGEIIAVLHSKLNDRERLFFWEEILKGKKKIVIGPRSAIFAPLKDIGLIVVDEEHENSYKQSERNPLYNGRDMAVLRGKLNNAVVILGSATPCLESYNNILRKKYKLIEMKEKVKKQITPKFSIVDMRQEREHTEIFSHLLKNRIEEKLNDKEQVILFQNRRGYASYIQCAKCGYVFRCPNCNISLTYHSNNQSMLCHYCGYSRQLSPKCPECKGMIYNFGSPGTEKIEKNLEYIFPTARIARMDRDTTHSKYIYKQTFDKVKNGYIDILLGTQMIIKGLDFPNITLVGIISADVNLNLPDFRAAERNFQHIIQVSGRTGRREKAGEVILQTYNPNHYSIQLGKKHNYREFFEYELAIRKKLYYPPFTKLVRILFRMKNETRLKNIILNMRKNLKQYNDKNILLLGPISAPINKIKKFYRYHIIIKASKRNHINKFISWFQNNIKIPSYVKTNIDVDPSSLL